MTSELYAMMADISEPERHRLTAAFAADPELAHGVAIVIAGLPRRVQEQVLRRLGVRLMRVPLGGGAFVAALTDVVYERLQRENAPN